MSESAIFDVFKKENYFSNNVLINNIDVNLKVKAYFSQNENGIRFVKEEDKGEAFKVKCFVYPLMLAIQNNNFYMVKKLVRKGANVNKSVSIKRDILEDKSVHEITPLGMALMNRNERIANFLLDNGANPSKEFVFRIDRTFVKNKDLNCETITEFKTKPVLYAVKNDMLNIAKRIINQNRESLQVYDYKNNSLAELVKPKDEKMAKEIEKSCEKEKFYSILNGLSSFIFGVFSSYSSFLFQKNVLKKNVNDSRVNSIVFGLLTGSLFYGIFQKPVANFSPKNEKFLYTYDGKSYSAQIYNQVRGNGRIEIGSKKSTTYCNVSDMLKHEINTSSLTAKGKDFEVSIGYPFGFF